MLARTRVGRALPLGASPGSGSAARPRRRAFWTPTTSSASSASPDASPILAAVASTRDQTRAFAGNKWVWVALGVSAAGFGAASSVHDDHRARTETPFPSDVKTTAAVAAAAAAAPGESSADKAHALKKRKSSLKDGTYLMSSAAVRGARTHMEDATFISKCKRFAAVYDGHGGASVAQYLKAALFTTVEPVLAQLDSDLDSDSDDKDGGRPEEEEKTLDAAALASRRQQVTAALKAAVARVDAEVLSRAEWKYQGSTCVGVLLFDDAIISLNVGDSRAILCRGGEAVELTRDHKPNDPEELARISSLGGSVKWHGYVDAQGEPMEPYGAYRINGNLAVARAVGDRDARPFVSGEPEVTAVERDYYKDEFIVVASDGLWDVFSNDEVVTFVQDVMSGEVGGRESWRSGAHSDTRVPIFEWSQQYKSDRSMIKAARARRKQQIANYLVQEALFRGTSDNVSVVVVWLR